MPTGYTAIIEYGDGCTFEEYAWRCVRAMGATIMMRDDNLDVPVTDERIAGISNYHRTALAKAEGRLIELRAMTPEGAAALATADYDAREASQTKAIARSQETHRRYADMRKQVKAWEPPTPEHVGLKEFMLQQISASTEYGPYSPPPIERLEPAAWLAEQIAKEEKDVAYHQRCMGEDKGRAAGRIAWVEAVRRSIPQPPPR